MSECMTIADVFAAEEKYSEEELTTAKDIVQSILTEAVHSVLVNSDKDSNHIGDCNVGEEYGFPLVNSSLEDIKSSQEKRCDEGKSKEYRVLKEQALENGELRIENGKIHTQKVIANPTNLDEIFQVKEVNKSQSCVSGGSDKKVDSSSENVLVVKPGQEKPEESWKEEEKKGEDFGDCERPFTPFTTEELRKSILQVWKNVNSPVLDGELVNQPEEVVRLMEGLATIQVTPNVAPDPNRPRACSLVEEDVKKMIKEIEDMNFKSSSEDVAAQNKGLEVEEDSETEEESQEEAVKSISGSGVAFESQKFNQSANYNTKEDVAASLTESDEAFIESSESVLQIIDPQEDSNEETEEGNAITFSLLNETDKEGEMMMDDPVQDDKEEEEEEEEMFPRFRSGMTTVGPIKNANCDPKLLTGPEVDYGKMTIISGSREITKKTPEESSKSSSSSRKILLDDAADDNNPVIFFENGYMEIDTIVNHDIASLTKMQKVKEVLSDQPKSDEDLRGDEKLMRSPLDLKDVDADSCESYNVIDIGIPLLTIEETTRSNSNKDIGEVILNEINFRASDSEEKNPETDNGKVDDHLFISSSFSCNKSVTQLPTSQTPKHNTISRVFQKASNKFIMKDSDSFLRNSRSLPRDTSKITNTESFRSLLDDCQTSAATVLKKSRSLLRNTQNALKAVSKTGFGHVVSGDKQTFPLEKTESRQSTSSRKNEFIKLKDTIKNKVEKTLKSLENIKPSSENHCEQQKKLSPKSPLVCPNQLRTPVTDQKSVELDKDGSEKEIEVICDVKFQGRFTESTAREESNAVTETANDSSAGVTQEENAESFEGGVTESELIRSVDAKKSLTLPVETNLDVNMGSDTLHKSLSNVKLARKNKKFSARIRSFWQTAFGKVKATTQKKDLS